MKNTVFALLAAALVMFLSPAAPAAPNPAPRAAAAAPAAPQDHPEIREAIAALRRAKDHLQHAKHDFSGHRAEALRATDEAIHQLEICLKYD